MTVFLKTGTLAILLFISFASLCKGDELYLVKKSQQATIVLSPGSSDVEQYAARELQRTISLMTGIKLRIVSTNETLPGVEIVIGTPATNKKVANFAGPLKLSAAKDEQIAVKRDGKTLYLAGKTPRAALYATYTFLQDVLGARWFWPGDSGEYIPKHETISVNELNISESPDLQIRSLAITGAPNGDPETDIWMARNKLNVISARPGTDNENIRLRREKGFLIRIAGHNIILPVELLQAHPEYLAEIGGKRQFHPRTSSHLCWSNPDVQNEVAKMIASWWDQSPYPDVIHFYPADQTQYCECANCKAMGDISTRWQKFSGILIDKVNQTHPGKRYWTYAYLEYKTVPLTTPAPFEFIGYTLYDASYRHFLSSGNDFNKLPLNEIDGWLSKQVNFGIRGYEYIIFKDPMFVPMVSWVVDQMGWIRNKNMTGYLSELPPYGQPGNVAVENTYWTTNRMALYAAAKAMWNTNLPADKIVDDWCSKIYGPAAPEMIRYYWDIEKAWRNSSRKISVFTNNPASHIDDFLSPGLFQRFYGNFSEALAKIEALDDRSARSRIESEISLERKMLDNWQTIYNLKYLRAGRYKLNIAKADIKSPAENFKTKLAQFEGIDGKPVKAQTDVSLAWTKDDLLLHIICHNQNGNAASKDDLEILIQPDPGKSGFKQFTIHGNGTKSASNTYSGIKFDQLSNTSWTVSDLNKNSARILTIKIPFTSIGIDPSDSTQFKMAVKRKMASGEISGWPDVFPASAANFGLVTLLDRVTEHQTPRIILYDSGIDSSPVSVELQKTGWEVAIESSNERVLKSLMAENTSALLIRFNNTNQKEFGLSDSFMAGDVKKYVENGGMLILAASGEIPVNKWFQEIPAVKFTDAKRLSVRKSSFVQPGDWLNYPNNINRILQTGVTPVSGYTPLSSGWDILAKIPMANGEDPGFLLTKRLGKGLLVLTTSPMGYSGGYDMFGTKNTTNVARLIENLHAQLSKDQAIKNN